MLKKSLLDEELYFFNWGNIPTYEELISDFVKILEKPFTLNKPYVIKIFLQNLMLLLIQRCKKINNNKNITNNKLKKGFNT